MEARNNTPDEFAFLAQVTAELVSDNYDRALSLFLDGVKLLLKSNTRISDEFEYHVAGPLTALITFKLRQNSVRGVTLWTSTEFDAGIRPSCSFCGKYEDQVEKLIGGPGIFICDYCVGICNQVLEQTGARQ